MRSLMIAALLGALAACGVPDTASRPASPPEPRGPERAAPAPSATEQPMAAPEVASATPAVAPAVGASQPTAPARPTLAPPPLADLALTAPAQYPPPALPHDGLAQLPTGLFERLRDHLAARTGGDPGSINLVGAEATIWSDGALGCPQPGVFYTQEPVEGYQVVLELAGQRYDYRVARSGAFSLCA